MDLYPDNAKYAHSLKIAILGASRSGKTSLLKGYITLTEGPDKDADPTLEKFQYDFPVHEPGITFKTKIYPLLGRLFRVQYWDVNGLEKYEDMILSLCSGCAGFILCYDVSNQESLTYLTTIYKKLLHLIPHPSQRRFVLVGMKSDLDWIVPEASAQEWAAGRHMPFFPVSAKTEYNLYQVFSDVFDRILQSIPHHPDPVKLLDKGIKKGTQQDIKGIESRSTKKTASYSIECAVDGDELVW
ncbi:Small GTPase like protein [Aduncisulcus paluster]|uniref:Small GTPase like protein n=1 Tax=Aduncisulcus paluster TaxID=2918883 RepID=A0ABQ5KM83_9EUKA|nr:Small GTPase like protein [Aduncisulcus paluster]|eukprot:gnl/Carplike_NY0171/5813_a7965_182.p1 GENE.gnl/Carplike_NY0171/5813_a7965_182~~gnl/Carplike_NY0171/5813_a7965_182.p1  ORF type:complete len:242 (-),score=32.58 gnl/Carplike_NY0171/5813_a7965_182:285-1010(-)